MGGLFITQNSTIMELRSKISNGSRFAALYEELGVFSYEQDGFVVRADAPAKKYFYTDIEAIVAYKVDRSSYDEVRLEIIFCDCALRILEDTPGWYRFIATIKEIFSSIPRNWEVEMLFPSFAMNLMVLYKRIV
jgi:hypothetical protein